MAADGAGPVTAAVLFSAARIAMLLLLLINVWRTETVTWSVALLLTNVTVMMEFLGYAVSRLLRMKAEMLGNVDKLIDEATDAVRRVGLKDKGHS